MDVFEKNPTFFLKALKVEQKGTKQFSKSVLDIKTRLVVIVELGTKWMPNSDSASNFMPEYKFLGYYDLPNSFYGYLKSPDFSRIRII